MARGYLKDLKQWWFFEDFTFLRENESKQAKRSNVSFRHDCIRNFAARLCNITGMSAAWHSGNRGCKGEIYSTALRHTTARFYSIGWPLGHAYAPRTRTYTTRGSTRGVAERIWQFILQLIAAKRHNYETVASECHDTIVLSIDLNS